MDIPANSNGTSTTKPPIGPATAISNNAVRSGNGSRILITAPIVPDSDGNGRK
jgi:hypothetical protein